MPRLTSHISTYLDCLDASGLTDHDYSPQDRAYRDSLNGGPRPQWHSPGTFDICDALTGHSPTSPAECFSRLCTLHNVHTWADLTPVVNTMRRLNGFAHFRIPDEQTALIANSLSPEEPDTISPEIPEPQTPDLLIQLTKQVTIALKVLSPKTLTQTLEALSCQLDALTQPF